MSVRRHCFVLRIVYRVLRTLGSGDDQRMNYVNKCNIYLTKCKVFFTFSNIE
jgi:hypothetical protein